MILDFMLHEKKNELNPDFPLTEGERKLSTKSLFLLQTYDRLLMLFLRLLGLPEATSWGDQGAAVG